MASENKVKNINISQKSGAFSAIFQKIKGQKKEKDSSGISGVRQILSNEKARLLHIIKAKKPNSIYELAKLLGRDFKAVRQDVKILEDFGFIELLASNKNGRERLKPVVDIDKLVISIEL